MNICLVMNPQNPVAREYLNYLYKEKYYLNFVIIIGDAADNEIDRIELTQTGGNWDPPSFSSIMDGYQVPVYYFKSKKSKNLHSFIIKKEVDIIIPIGIGVLKKYFLELPIIGCLNVHPGNLPYFRGCSCPEWQILTTGKFYATAHFMDEGIDTGPILYKKEMKIELYWGYHEFRSMVYFHCAKVLLETIKILQNNTVEDLIKTQKDNEGKYWKPMKNPDDIAKVKLWFEKNKLRYLNKK